MLLKRTEVLASNHFSYLMEDKFSQFMVYFRNFIYPTLAFVCCFSCDFLLHYIMPGFLRCLLFVIADTIRLEGFLPRLRLT